MLGLTAFLRQLTNTRSLDVSVVDGNGDQVTSFSSVATAPTTAVLTNVTVSNISATLLTANASRRRFLLYNDSGALIFVAFAATATNTAYTIELPNNTLYESELNDYTGVISAIRNAGTGAVRVTEITV